MRTPLRYGIRGSLLLASLAVVGCDYSGDFLFPGSAEGLDDIFVLTAEDGGVLVPVDVASVDDVRANTIYAEVGAPQTTGYGGVTVDFKGTGGDVCLWVDPELTTWNQAVAQRPSDISRKWTYPDNIFDDGDMDVFAGLSVYYTGSPGEEIGDFVVSYEDSLGNEIPISLAACPNTVGSQGDDATAGRGSPEYCTIPATDLDIDYTILLRTWSTPLDDDRLAFAFILTNGPCNKEPTDADPSIGLRQVVMGTGPIPERDECVLMGEALTPEPGSFGPFYGFDAVEDRIWPRSMDFETQFCTPYDSEEANKTRMKSFCDDELAELEANGASCEWETITDPANRCYCGNPENSPDGGAN